MIADRTTQVCKSTASRQLGLFQAAVLSSVISSMIGLIMAGIEIGQG